MADDEMNLVSMPIQGDHPRDPGVDSLTLRLLRDMRSEHAAAMQAVTTELTTMRRLYANMERMFDRLDDIKAELTVFRAETGKSLRGLQGDVIAAEGQDIARRSEIIDAINRITEVEVAMVPKA